MNENALAVRQDGQIIEAVLMKGDLKELTPAQRVEYYMKVCNSLDLNYLVKPFDYLYLNNKLTLYATKTATDQLAEKRNISITLPSKEVVGDLYVVTARAQFPDGRIDENMGVVNISGLKGADLANAMMKCVTKAKRRVTLSACGLGFLDETEIETIADAKHVTVTPEGEIIDPPAKPAPRQAAPAKPALKPTSEPVIISEAEQVERVQLMLQIEADRQFLVLGESQLNVNAVKHAGVKDWRDAKTEYLRDLAGRMKTEREKKEQEKKPEEVQA